MARKIQDIQLDITQVKQLILSAKRPQNQAVLAKHLSTLKSQLSALTPPKIQPLTAGTTEQSPQPQPQSNEQPQKVQPPKSPQQPQKNISYTALTKYSWDQQGKKVKIYFSLQGVGDQCKANQIDVKFQNESVELKIRDYNKGNFIFAIRKLYAPIEKQTCTYLVKTNTISLTLIKKQSKNWSQLAYKQDSLNKQKKQEKEENPQDSIMKMMKKMYDEGDDNMKRTIAEAWTKSREGKGPDMGDMGGLGGMGGMGGMGGLGGMGGMGGMGGLGGMGGFGGLGGDMPSFKPKKN